MFCFIKFSKNVKLGIYKTVTFLVALYGCETWSLTVREEHRLRACENRVLAVFGLKRDKLRGGWRTLLMKSVITCILHQA
jgi:hypothetical protein